jgi:hypothetical protein
METVSFVFMAAGLGTAPVVLWWMGRMNNRPWDEWQTILDAEGHRAYRTLQQRMQWNRELIDDTYGKAMSARYRGAVDDSLELVFTLVRTTHDSIRAGVVFLDTPCAEAIIHAQP